MKSKTSSRSTSHPKLATTHQGLIFIRRFQHYLAKNNLLPRGSKVLVAVSGGPDSMTLLAVLRQLQSKHTLSLHVAHVNYGLRGHDSDRDEKLVQDFCKKNALPYSTLHPRTKPKKNIEATLRAVRYAWFEKLRKRLGFDVVVTGHTKNDLAETLLLNLIRGAGTLGLSPFQRQSPSLARPLIAFTRADIEAFLEAEGIPFRIDKSNFSPQFTRNRVRHELIPLLETFNPRIVDTLAKTAIVLGEKSQPISLDTNS